MTRTGWNAKVVSGFDWTSLMGVLPNFIDITATSELSGVGGGAVTIPSNDDTLKADLPPGLTTVRSVPVEGIYPDHIARADSISPITTAVPHPHKGFVNVGSNIYQFLRIKIDGVAYQGKAYVWYQDDSNCVEISWGLVGGNANNIGIVLVNGGTRTTLATTSTGPSPIAGDMWCVFANLLDGQVGFFPLYDGGFGANYSHTVTYTGIWSGFPFGTKVGYDFTGLGTINPDIHATASDGEQASFAAYAVRPDIINLGNFPTIANPWQLWLPIYRRTPMADGITQAPSLLEVYNNGFQPAWHPVGLGGKQDCAVVDVGTADGSWQMELRNVGTTSQHALLVRCTSGGQGIQIGTGSSLVGHGVSTMVSTGGGVLTPIGSTYWPSGEQWQDGDILRCVMSGPSLKVYRNGVLLGTYSSTFQQTSTLMGVSLTSYPTNIADTPSEMREGSETAPYEQNFPRVVNPTWIGISTVPVTVSPSDMLSDENLWILTEDGTNRCSFLAENVEDDVVQDDGTRVTKISGRGPAAVLEWGKVFPKSWPTPNGEDWTFNAVPIMAAFRTLFAACQARGTLDWVTLDFTDTADSDGVPWDDISDVQANVGDNLLDTLTRWCSLISADWQMGSDFVLHVRQNWGDHKETTIVFEPQQAVLMQTRNRMRNNIINYIGTKATTKGTKNHKSQDYYGRQIDTASIGRYHQRESWQEAGDATTLNQAQVVANAAIEQNKLEYAGFTVQVVPDDPDRKMFEDYKPGDWIGLRMDDNVSSGAYRALAFTVSLDSECNATGELTIQSKRDIAIRRLQQAIDKMGAQTASGSSSTHIPSTTYAALPSLEELTDVDADNRAVGQSLKWNGSSWIPYTPTGSITRLAQLTDVDLTGLTNGYLLVWNSTTGRWEPHMLPTQIPSGGSTGQILKKNSGSNYDVGWGNDVGFANPTTAKGDLIVNDGSAPARFVVGSDGQILYADSTQPKGVRWGAVPSGYTDPLTTKGDLVGHSNVATVRVPVGADGQALLADSTQSAGVKWGAIFADPMTTKGDLIVRGTSADARLGVGADGQVLTADSTAPNGVKWGAGGSGGSGFTRTTAAYTTASLAANATETGTIAMAIGYRLINIAISGANARVRLYGTPAERTADASRAWGVDPSKGSGLVLDFQTTTGTGNWDLSPSVDGFSTESTPTVNIPIAITALAAGTITVTLTYIRTE